MEEISSQIESAPFEATRDIAKKRAEEALMIPESEKRSHFDNFRRQVIDAKIKRPYTIC